LLKTAVFFGEPKNTISPKKRLKFTILTTVKQFNPLFLGVEFNLLLQGVFSKDLQKV